MKRRSLLWIILVLCIIAFMTVPARPVIVEKRICTSFWIGYNNSSNRSHMWNLFTIDGYIMIQANGYWILTPWPRFWKMGGEASIKH
jgi:hypothetical protein